MLTDGARQTDPVRALQNLRPGDGVIFRHYGDAQREDLGKRLRKAAKARRILFLVAGDLRLMLRLNADGFHAPEALAHRLEAARRARPNIMLTLAAHGGKALNAARRWRPHALLLSPVFETQSHPGAKPLGVIRFEALARRAPCPVYALGGVNSATAQRLNASAAFGLAGIAAFNS